MGGSEKILKPPLHRTEKEMYLLEKLLRQEFPRYMRLPSALTAKFLDNLAKAAFVEEEEEWEIDPQSVLYLVEMEKKLEELEKLRYGR
jgi:hypothetical protein